MNTTIAEQWALELESGKWKQGAGKLKTGPAILRKDGQPSQHQPRHVLDAIHRWKKLGKKVKAGLCQWQAKRRAKR